MSAAKRRYVEPFLGGGAVLLGLLGERAGLETPPSPFLRWAGGKRRLYQEIRQRLCVATASQLDFVVADVNVDLIAAWQAVRDSDGEMAIDWLSTNWPRSDEDYYAVRSMKIEPQAVVSRGARQIYLNLFAFNGLNRQNKRGEFNAPCDKARIANVKLDTVATSLRSIAKLLVGVDIVCADFSTTLSRCGDGDVVYCDPPYFGTFTGYSAGGFDEEQQYELAIAVEAAALRGARVVISNSVAAKQLYDDVLSKLPGYRVDVVRARRSVSCRGDGRGVVDEILVTVGE